MNFSSVSEAIKVLLLLEVHMPICRVCIRCSFHEIWLLARTFIQVVYNLPFQHFYVLTIKTGIQPNFFTIQVFWIKHLVELIQYETGFRQKRYSEAFVRAGLFYMSFKAYSKTESTSLAILTGNENLAFSSCPAPPFMPFIIWMKYNLEVWFSKAILRAFN